jgi:protein-S-isoprenylcysteine O-methyltransferase Ste14
VGDRQRPLRPGEAQRRRFWFCVKLLGLVFVVGFVSAATIGIASPSIWQAFFVPTLVFAPAILILFTVVFFLRWAWFRLKARHYGALVKLATDRDYS